MVGLRFQGGEFLPHTTGQVALFVRVVRARGFLIAITHGFARPPDATSSMSVCDIAACLPHSRWNRSSVVPTTSKFPPQQGCLGLGRCVYTYRVVWLNGCLNETIKNELSGDLQWQRSNMVELSWAETKKPEQASRHAVGRETAWQSGHRREENYHVLVGRISN